MTLLVADVGGTNTRIALARHAGQIVKLTRFHNADFNTFDEVLLSYTGAQDLSDLKGCCIAVAGPVASGRAELTNRDWSFDPAAIAGLLPPLRGAQVHLVNDLVALGYSLPALSPVQLDRIRPSNGPEPLSKQALVVGLGTGFNICVAKPAPGGPVVVEAELGHASLPASVSSALSGQIGSDAAQFPTYEHLFSGRGLSRLYRHYSGGPQLTGAQILAAFDPARHDAAAQTVELTARMLGLATRELVFQYLPYGGIYFAGGVARGILGSPARELFLETLDAPGPFGDHIARVPVRMIKDDAAGLLGAAHFAGRMA